MILLISFAITSCSSIFDVSDSTLSKKISSNVVTHDLYSDFQKIILKYDLYNKNTITLNKINDATSFDEIVKINNVQKNPSRIFNTQYSEIINNPIVHKKSLQVINIDQMDLAILEKNSKNKIMLIRKVILNLDRHYRLLSPKDKKLLLDNKYCTYHLERLLIIDKHFKHIPMMLPQKSPNITGYYGKRSLALKKFDAKRKRYTTFVSKFHGGIDMQSKLYSPVYASAAGTVIECEYKPCYGKYITIDHGKGIQTKYAHLHKTKISKGSKVLAGQIIGIQGKTGRVTGHHLHFEVLKDNKKIDPLPFIAFTHANSTGKIYAKDYSRIPVITRKKSIQTKHVPTKKIIRKTTRVTKKVK